MRLESKGKKLGGILITHEHSDIFRGSVCSAGNTKFRFMRQRGTIEGIKAYKGIGKMPEGLLKEVTVDQMFSIGNLDIRPFAISHDANEPSGFRIEHDGKSLAVATDLGIYDAYTVENLKGLDAICLRQTMMYICWKWEHTRII